MNCVGQEQNNNQYNINLNILFQWFSFIQSN